MKREEKGVVQGGESQGGMEGERSDVGKIKREGGDISYLVPCMNPAKQPTQKNRVVCESNGSTSYIILTHTVYICKEVYMCIHIEVFSFKHT